MRRSGGRARRPPQPKGPSPAQRQLTQLKRQAPFAALPPPPQPPTLTETEQGKIADLQQARADRRTLGKTAKRDRQAAYGAARMLRAGLAQAADELRAQGLTGPELDDAIKEFTARQVDALAGARLQSQTINNKYREDRATATADIVKGKAEKRSIFSNLRSQTTQDQADYNQKVGKAQLDSQIAGLTAKVAAQNDAASSGSSGGMTPTQQRALATARQNAMIGVRAALRAASPDDIKKITANPQAFVTSAASHIEGASPVDIRWALRRIIQQVQAAQNPGRAQTRTRRQGLGGARSQALLGR